MAFKPVLLIHIQPKIVFTAYMGASHWLQQEGKLDLTGLDTTRNYRWKKADRTLEAVWVKETDNETRHL